MYQAINFSQFCDAFNPNRTDQFTYNGKRALFDWLEEYKESTGEQYEIDIIAICCEWTEYKDLIEFQENYGKDYETIEDIEDATLVILIKDNGFMVQNF